MLLIGKEVLLKICIMRQVFLYGEQLDEQITLQ